MCVTATAIRRRKQAVDGYRHLPMNKRPNYNPANKTTYEGERLAKLLRGRKKR